MIVTNTKQDGIKNWGLYRNISLSTSMKSASETWTTCAMMDRSTWRRQTSTKAADPIITTGSACSGKNPVKNLWVWIVVCISTNIGTVCCQRKGGESSWSGPWHLGCTLEVFHVHSYQPGWAECVFCVFTCSLGLCSRLSQLSFWAHCNIVLLTYFVFICAFWFVCATPITPLLQ